MTRLFYSLLCGVGGFALAGQALAQDGEPRPASAPERAPQTEASEDDIVVTALRRSENLQDVPVSVSALGGEALEKQRLMQVSDLAGSIPNLQASTVAGDGLAIFSLRGVSMSDFSFNQQGPVATYFDEVYKGSFPLLPLAMFDLERVEVLRGPQGTLYGKNTTGGAINFISRKPGYDTEAYLRIGYGNYDRIDAEGAVQTALGDKAAARIAFTFARADGWFKNLLPGKPAGSAVRQYGVRASFLLEPSDDLDFVLRLSTSLQNPIEYGILGRPVGTAGIGGGVYEMFGGASYFRTGLGRRETESDNVGRHRHRTYGASFTGNWHVSDSLTVTSVSSYDYGKLFVLDEGDGTPLRVLEADLRGSGRQFSQDLRLSSDSDGPFNFILGAYYNYEKLRNATSAGFYSDIDVNGDGALDADDCVDSAFAVSCIYRNRYAQVRKSAAVYSDVNYKLSDQVVLRGGLRYTRDVGNVRGYSAQIEGPDGTPIVNTIPGDDPFDFGAAASARFRKGIVTGKVGIDFKTADDDLLYASFSRGYRANAFNAQAYFSPTELNVADPETVNAYELGFKTRFLDRAVTLNGAIFYYDYRSQQAISVDSTTHTQSLINIPKSRIFGGELELVVRPVDGVRINAGLGLLSTKIREGTLTGVSLEGNRLPNAPKVGLSVGLDWDVIETRNGKLSWGVNGSYTSKQYFDLFNTDRTAQKGYVLVNSNLTYRFADDRYGIGIWAKNIFDKYYARYTLDLSGAGFDYVHLGDPRTYGVSLDAKF
ncbi:TonB-dependent receptor [Sphingopyxis chilensis]|uniref:TonB-dependent receptor n=1 Tax=Sphingopyxis chilensis TaxID=180400 RepID=UPI002DDCA1E4|nr:TonB-dependent receptor [Sphingopyxis chilensis]